MEIAIGKLFFLVSSTWALVVLYRIAADLLTSRKMARRDRRHPSQPPMQSAYSEKSNQAQSN